MRFMPGVLMSVLFVGVLAGCIRGTDDSGGPNASVDDVPVAVLKCFPMDMTMDMAMPVPTFTAMSTSAPRATAPAYDPMDHCNQEMTPDPERRGNEVTIAVNPMNPLNIVGGAKDYFPADAGECVWDGVYVSHDGGATYEDRSFDGSPWRLRAGDVDNYQPNYASQFWCTTDPVAYFDTQGNLYYLLMAYQADPVTGSKTCIDICEDGALNDWAFNRAVQIVAVSSDGGDTFHTFTPVLEGSYPVAFHDKGWIAASPDGTIHVLWLSFVLGNLYFRSTDGGMTYSDPEVLADFLTNGGQGSFVDVGPGNEVYAIWTNGGGIQMRRSFDKGDTWDAQRSVLSVDVEPMPGHSPRDRRGGYPSLATDRWDGSPLVGALYTVWQNKGETGASDILFSASFDEGETWSDPVALNDDVTGNGSLDPTNWQIFPAVSVSQGGVIDVSWMDSRVDPDDVLLDQYYTYSLDGGKTWAQNFRVRDADDLGWDTNLSFHQNGMVFIGDYNDIDSSWGAGHPVWPDTRYGLSDVFTAVVQRPLFADGWSEEDKARLRVELVAAGLVEADHPFLDR